MSENSNITKHKETSQFQLQVSQTSQFPSIVYLSNSVPPLILYANCRNNMTSYLFKRNKTLQK